MPHGSSRPSAELSVFFGFNYRPVVHNAHCILLGGSFELRACTARNCFAIQLQLAVYSTAAVRIEPGHPRRPRDLWRCSRPDRGQRQQQVAGRLDGQDTRPHPPDIPQHPRRPRHRDMELQQTQQALSPATEHTGYTIEDPLVYRCQRKSIAAALTAGVRFFDLRYALDPTSTFLIFWHNAALLSERASVDDVLFSFWAWLDAHPSETVLLSFQYQGSTQEGAANDAAVQGQLFSILTSDASRRYFHQAKNALPSSLGDARGKAILFRRFDMDQVGDGSEYDALLPGLHLLPAKWTDNDPDIVLVYNEDTGATAYIEDRYQPTELSPSANATVNIDAKLNATVSHLQKAVSQQHPESLFLTFASGGNLDADEPVYPRYMALGNGTDMTPSGGVNAQLVPVLEGMRGERKGVVVLDYFDEPRDLVELVLD